MALQHELNLMIQRVYLKVTCEADYMYLRNIMGKCDVHVYWTLYVALKASASGQKVILSLLRAWMSLFLKRTYWQIINAHKWFETVIVMISCFECVLTNFEVDICRSKYVRIIVKYNATIRIWTNIYLIKVYI